MEIRNLIDIISQNISGIKSRSKVSIETETIKEATDLFEVAKLRMLAVNYWHVMSGVTSPVFQLTDVNGQLLNKNAEIGNFIRIESLVSLEDEKYEWVKIELIQYEKNPKENSESIVLLVKPTPNPALTNHGISHFYENAVSTSFIIKRKGSKITAYQKETKEVKNAGFHHFLDKIRNFIVLDNMKISLSALKWRSLFESWIYQM